MERGAGSALAIQQLLGPASGLQIVNISDPTTNLGIAEEVLAAAQATRRDAPALLSRARSATSPGGSTPRAPSLRRPTM